MSKRLILIFETLSLNGPDQVTDYVFDRCTGPGGTDLIPGHILSVSAASLRILQADKTQNKTSVIVQVIESGLPAPGTPDYFSLIVFGPDGGISYSYGSDFICGDIDIHLPCSGSGCLP